MAHRLRRVDVVSTGSYLPGDPISNADVERLVGPLPEEILDGLQVKSRHWIVDPLTGEHRESNSDLAYRATAQALERAGVARRWTSRACTWSAASSRQR